MLYYVSLDGREFPLTVLALADTGPSRLESAGAELEVEVLSHSGPGRPALVVVDGSVYRVQAAARPTAASPAPRRAAINGQPIALGVENELERRARPHRNRVAAVSSQIRAPMPGRVVKVNVRPGDAVTPGTPLLGIEAMKMENELNASTAGTVTKVNVQVGSTVEADQELIVIEPA